MMKKTILLALVAITAIEALTPSPHGRAKTALPSSVLEAPPSLANGIARNGKQNAKPLQEFGVRVVHRTASHAPSKADAPEILQDILSKREHFARRVQASREKAFQVSEKKNSRPLLRPPPPPTSTGMPLAAQRRHFEARIAAARQRTIEVTKLAAKRAREARENPPPPPILAPVKVSFKSSAYNNLQANVKP